VSATITVDSSALAALAFDEGDAAQILDAILAADTRRMGAFTMLETTLVVTSRKGAAGQAILDSLIEVLDLEVVPLDADQVREAGHAWRRFGKGHHPAALNIGDCCSYAVARLTDSPLLCKGNDFPQTDLELVEYQPARRRL